MTADNKSAATGKFNPDLIRAVIFDFDGTLAETNIDFALMRERVLEVAERWGLRERLNPRRYILEIVDDAASLLSGEDAARFRAEAAEAMMEVELISTSVAAPFPGVPETLARLRACGRRVGIITRNCRAGVASVIERHPLDHEVLLTRDDVECVKPHPGHLHLALEALDVAPGEALMVGDHVTDIETGKAAGTFTAGVLTANTTREQFEEVGADLILESVAELADLLCPGE